MSTILMALGMVGFVALIVIILMFVHRRDQKAEAGLNKDFFNEVKG